MTSARDRCPCRRGWTRRRWLLSAAALGAAGLAGIGRARADEGIRSLDFDWVDESRERPVPARLHLPAAADRTARVPLIVFSHGIGGSRAGYRYLGAHWAAQGIASLHVQHVGSDRSVWFGNVFGLVGRLHDAATDGEAVARVQDLRFALDRLLEAPPGDAIDAARIAAAGHSYGANTTLLAAGARVRRDGRVVDLRDPRLRAAIVLSAPPFYGEPSFEPILGPVDLPSLHVTATGDEIRIPGFWSGLDDRIAVFDAIGGRPKALAVFEGGSHSIFTDRGGTGGPVLNPQVKTATRELTTAFLQRVFGIDGDALARWPARHAGIVARFDAVGL
ncbi:MAG: hypothetical protein MUF03_05240 [Rubrivivax sp.]|nr:hypothetical protein [Rubrivivax sp.]